MTIREKLIDIAIYNKGEFKDTLNFIKSKKPIADSNRDYSNYTSKIVLKHLTIHRLLFFIMEI